MKKKTELIREAELAVDYALKHIWSAQTAASKGEFINCEADDAIKELQDAIFYLQASYRIGE